MLDGNKAQGCGGITRYLVSGSAAWAHAPHKHIHPTCVFPCSCVSVVCNFLPSSWQLFLEFQSHCTPYTLKTGLMNFPPKLCLCTCVHSRLKGKGPARVHGLGIRIHDPGSFILDPGSRSLLESAFPCCLFGTKGAYVFISVPALAIVSLFSKWVHSFLGVSCFGAALSGAAAPCKMACTA